MKKDLSIHIKKAEQEFLNLEKISQTFMKY